MLRLSSTKKLPGKDATGNDPEAPNDSESDLASQERRTSLIDDAVQALQDANPNAP